MVAICLDMTGQTLQEGAKDLNEEGKGETIGKEE